MSETAGTKPEASADSLVGLLNQLAEVPEPEAVSMVPQTAGWAVLGGILFLAMLIWAWRIWKAYQANAYRREALEALNLAADDAAEISAVLKRVALTAYGRKQVASLSGDAWLAFLDKTGGATPKSFQQGAGRVLAAAAYRAEPVPADQELRVLARQWVKQHSVSYVAGAGDV